MKPAPQAPRRTVDEDVEAVQGVDALDTMLRVLCRTTGLRIAMVVRMQPDTWTCCAVLDEAGFGLAPGDRLDFATTY